MKIVLTGGGSGGHFYPLIAVAEEINRLIQENKLVEAKMFYLAGEPYDSRALFENNIAFRRVPGDKLRRWSSWRNWWGSLKTAWGVLVALWRLYWIYPDVVFGKGGYDSFPTLAAAKLLKIPVIIHESDSQPGRVNLWAAKFADRIAVAFSEAMRFFPAEKTALVGNPIRQEVLHPIRQGAHLFLKLESEIPVIYFTGGSQGALTLNEIILDILPRLLEKYQVIHQIGKNHFADNEKRAAFVLEQSRFQNRYKPFALLNSAALQMVAGVAELAVSRAGAGTIFELAQWGIPAILIPIPEAVAHDQRENAFTYARSGAAAVIEQGNLTPSVLLAEINRLMENPSLREKMKQGAKGFARPDAGRVIAEEIINFALGHERE